MLVDLTQRDKKGSSEDQPITEGRFSIDSVLKSRPREYEEGEVPDPSAEWEVNDAVVNLLSIPNPGHSIVQIPGVRSVDSRFKFDHFFLIER